MLSLEVNVFFEDATTPAMPAGSHDVCVDVLDEGACALFAPGCFPRSGGGACFHQRSDFAV